MAQQSAYFHQGPTVPHLNSLLFYLDLHLITLTYKYVLKTDSKSVKVLHFSCLFSVPVSVRCLKTQSKNEYENK